MKAYRTIKFFEEPDLGDIRSQGRKSSIGRIKRGETFVVFPSGIVRDREGNFKGITKVKRNERGYCKPHAKAVVRRALKRADRARTAKIDFAE